MLRRRFESDLASQFNNRGDSVAKKKETFPEILYVEVCDYDDEEPLFAADASPAAIEDGQPVAVYKLVKVGRKRVTHELVD